MPTKSLSHLSELEKYHRLKGQLATNQRRYIENHREQININAKNYYHRHKDDPEFIEKRNKLTQKAYEKVKAKRALVKAQKQNQTTTIIISAEFTDL